MALDLSTANDVLKVFYLPTLQRLLNNATILLQKLDRDSSTQDAQGKSFTVSLHRGRNLSAGIPVGELDNLPPAGNQVYGTAVVPNKYIYATIQVSGQVIRATRNNAGAFIKAIESEVKGALTDLKRSANFQFHGNGTGALAYWTAADNASPVDVDDNRGNAFTHLPVGQAINLDLVDASDHATVLNTGSLVATLGAEAATTFSLAWTGGTVAGTADGDYVVYRNPNAAVPAGSTFGKFMMGLEGIISDVDPPNAGGQLPNGLHGLAVASNQFWKAQIVGSDAAKRDLSFADMQRVLSKIAINSSFSESDVKFLLSSYQMRDKYVELATNERVIVNKMRLDGGFEAVDYNGIPLVPDNQSARGRIYFVVPETMAIFRTSDFEWMDDDHGGILQRVQGKDAYGATLYHYGDLAVKNRPGNGALIGINE